MNWKKVTPVILSIVSIAGIGATVYFAAKETPEANDNLEAARENKRDDLTKVDKAIILAKSYKKTLLFGGATVGCVIASQISNNKAQLAIAGAYPVLERTYKEYQGKVKDILGIDAHNQVVKSMVEDSVGQECELYDEEDDELYFDNLSDPETVRTFYDTEQQCYFYSTIQRVNIDGMEVLVLDTSYVEDI